MHVKLPLPLPPRRCAAWVAAILLLVLLTLVIGQFMQPRYQGKTASAWFEQAVLNAPQSPWPASGTKPETASFQECTVAFRHMGKRGIGRVVDEYIQQTPFYLEWYDRAAIALRNVVKLPARAQPNRFRESLVAHRLLLRIGADAIPEVIRRTRSRNPSLRARAVTVLGELGPGNSKAQTCLFRMLGDASVEVVYRSLEVLWMTLPEPGTAVPAIVPLLTHTNDRVRVEASYAIGSLMPVPEPVLGTLVTLLSDSDGTVRANAARAIGLSGVRSEPIYALLEARLGDTNRVARFRAAEALARLYGPEVTNRTDSVLKLLAESEKSEQSYFRLIGLNTRTALGAGEWPSETLDGTFRELFANENAYVRSEAIAGLVFHSETCRTSAPPTIMNLVVRAREDVNGLIRHQATLLLESNER